jgi:hypothetical protein
MGDLCANDFLLYFHNILGRADESTESSDRSCAKNPGDCSVEECEALQAQVKLYKSGRKCMEGDSIQVLQEKMAQFINLRDARKNINNKCFKGGDKGHQQAEDDVKRAISNCETLIEKLKG